MVRRAAVFSLCLGLTLGTIACGGPDVAKNPRQTASAQTEQVAVAKPQAKLADGKYPVQQASFNDGDGAYSMMLLDTPQGVPPLFESEQLAMARLTEEEVKAGQTSYLKMEGGKPSLHLTPDFKLEYTHNVAEERPNPQTGVKETVVVRQESSFWSPFAGAIAGQVVGNMLFRPQYYMPPMYQPGGVMMGYGGYGSTYGGAVNQYQERYNQAPAVERNRQSFRTTGRLRRESAATAPGRTRPATGTKASGSGFGTSTLRRSGSTPTKSTGAVRRPSNSSFGSSRSVRPARSSFGGSRGGRRR